MLDFMHNNRGPFLFSLNNRADFLSRESVCHYSGILLIIFTLIFMFYSDVSAETAPGDRLFKDDNNSNEPWNLTADEITYDRNADIYTASGNVLIIKNSRKLTADFVRFDHKAFHAHAQGNVTLKAGEDVLTGSSMDMVQFTTERYSLKRTTLISTANQSKKQVKKAMWLKKLPFQPVMA